MIFDLNEKNSAPGREYDIVIVGGGTVSLFLANLIATSNKSVAILESGGTGFESDYQDLNDVLITGRAHNGVKLGRARLLGGTSNLWGGQLTPFLKSDFQKIGDCSSLQWPIEYDEISPYFSLVEKELNLPATISKNSNIGKTLFRGGLPVFDGLEIFFTRWLREPNFASLYAKKAIQHKNFDVFVHAHVSGVQQNSSEDKILGVDVFNSKNDKFSFFGKEFVLANGTIEISRFLLNCGVQYPDAVWAKNSWIGRGFQDHLGIKATKIHIKDRKKFSESFQNIIFNGNKYQAKLRFSEGFGTEKFNLNVTGFFSYESSASEHFQHLKVFVKSILRGQRPKNIGDFFRSLNGAKKVWLPMIVDYFRHHRIYSPSDNGVWLNLHCEQVPIADSAISLNAKQLDRFGNQTAIVNWKIDGQEEVFAIKKFVKLLASDKNFNEMATIETEFLHQTDDVILSSTHDTYHHCGGARLGHNYSDGVVDKDLKIFGTSNLYVAGAAIFPTSSYANPTLTALAFAARLAEKLSQADDQ